MYIKIIVNTFIYINMKLYNNSVDLINDTDASKQFMKDFTEIFSKTGGCIYTVKISEPRYNTDIITRVVTELSRYILKLTDNTDNEEYYSEFWFKSGNNQCNNLHLDCDDYDRIVNKNLEYRKPIQTGILYLTDCNNVPTTIIDGLDNIHNIKLVYSFPKKNNLLVFNGASYLHGNSYFHESVNDISRQLLVINIWKKTPPMCVPMFNYDTFKGHLFQQTFMSSTVIKADQLIKYANDNKDLFKITLKNDNIAKIILHREMCITQDILNHYVNNNKEALKILNVSLYNNLCGLLETTNRTIFIIENQEITESGKISCSENKNGIAGIDKINLKINTEESRYLQRMVIPKIFTRDICQWFISEIQDYTKVNGWKTDRHDTYPTTDIEVKTIPCLFKFMLMSVIQEIHRHINATYCISNTSMNIADMFVVKYDLYQQRSLDVHRDNCNVTASILLSDAADFSGCHVEYTDGIRYDNINQGDMIIHTNKHAHFVNRLISGTRYVLVIFLDVCLN